MPVLTVSVDTDTYICEVNWDGKVVENVKSVYVTKYDMYNHEAGQMEKRVGFEIMTHVKKEDGTTTQMSITANNDIENKKATAEVCEFLQS